MAKLRNAEWEECMAVKKEDTPWLNKYIYGLQLIEAFAYG